MSDDHGVECESNRQWNASNPTCDPVDCGNPGVPINGRLHGDIYTYTSIVTFSCSNGYILSDNYGRECESNGQWNTSNPTCDPVDCGNPGVPDNGQAHGDIYTYTSIITFSCDTGYTLSGNYSIECQSNGQWNTSNPICDPVDCGNPGVPDNGQTHGNIYTYTSIVTFSCDTGYALSDDHGVECESNRQWNTSNPTCDPVDCGNPGVPINGRLHGDIYTYTSIVTFSCSNGYILSDNYGRECESNGQWNTSNPTCDPVDCGNPGVPDNGQAHGDIYTYTSILTFSCDIGYILSGNYSIECQSNGQWNASNPICDPVDCGNPGVPDNGQAHGDIYTYNSVINYTCNEGYLINGSRSIACQDNREWSNAVPGCVRVCDDPGVPSNATRDREGPFSEGNSITYRCTGGYTIDGIPTITCLATGEWSSAVPLCSRGEKLIIGVFACEIYVSGWGCDLC